MDTPADDKMIIWRRTDRPHVWVAWIIARRGEPGRLYELRSPRATDWDMYCEGRWLGGVRDCYEGEAMCDLADKVSVLCGRAVRVRVEGRP